MADEMVAEVESMAAHLPSDGDPRKGLAVASLATRHAEEA